MIGPGDAIEHNAKITQQLDWEIELAVADALHYARSHRLRRATASTS